MKKRCPGCRKVMENVSALFDGELRMAEAKVLVKRIYECAEEGCNRCLSLFEDLRELESVMAKCRRSPCKPPAKIVADLKRRLRRVLKGTHWKTQAATRHVPCRRSIYLQGG